MASRFTCLDASSWDKHSALERPRSGSYIYFLGILHPVRFSMPLE
jgi:hypothetical protein